jgi:hypothetical protein
MDVGFLDLLQQPDLSEDPLAVLSQSFEEEDEDIPIEIR